MAVAALLLGIALMGQLAHSTNVQQVCSNSNLNYNPHCPPSPLSGSWFEGWYSRATTDDGVSLAIGVGHFPGQEYDSPSVACFALLSAPGRPMAQYTQYFDQLHIVGHSCPSAPPTGGQLALALEAVDEASRQHCSWDITADRLTISARISGLRANITLRRDACSASSPWGRKSSSEPEGWAAALPMLLKLHWDVLSLRTPANLTFVLEDDEGQEAQQGRRSGGGGGAAAASADATPSGGGGGIVRRAISAPALVHLEKNWGRSFPDEWVWLQAHALPAQLGAGYKSQAAFVLAGGLLPHALTPTIPAVRQYVFSYHPPSGSADAVTVDPWDPALFSETIIEGCFGRLSVVLYSAWHVVEVRAVADPDSFIPVTCPTNAGFKNFSVESFTARVELQVYGRAYPFQPRAWATLLYRNVFEDAALEFGGAYVCPDNAVQQGKATSRPTAPRTARPEEQQQEEQKAQSQERGEDLAAGVNNTESADDTAAMADPGAQAVQAAAAAGDGLGAAAAVDAGAGRDELPGQTGAEEVQRPGEGVRQGASVRQYGTAEMALDATEAIARRFGVFEKEDGEVL